MCRNKKVSLDVKIRICLYTLIFICQCSSYALHQAQKESALEISDTLLSKSASGRTLFDNLVGDSQCSNVILLSDRNLRVFHDQMSGRDVGCQIVEAQEDTALQVQQDSPLQKHWDKNIHFRCNNVSHIRCSKTHDMRCNKTQTCSRLFLTIRPVRSWWRWSAWIMRKTASDRRMFQSSRNEIEAIMSNIPLDHPIRQSLKTKVLWNNLQGFFCDVHFIRSEEWRSKHSHAKLTYRTARFAKLNMQHTLWQHIIVLNEVQNVLTYQSASVWAPRKHHRRRRSSCRHRSPGSTGHT